MKYLRTYYNNQKIILKVSLCNDCPLMRFHENEMKCTCRMFSDKKTGNNVLDNWAVNYNIFGTVFDNISIPKWCELSNTMEELFFSKLSYYPNPVSVIIETSHDNYDYNTPILNAKIKKLENINFIYRLVQNNTKKNTIKHIDNKTTINKDNKNYNYNDDYDILKNYESNYNLLDKICSLCGEKHDTVNRMENNGMCKKCYEKYNNDKIKMNQSFINNFRLKRNVDILEKEIKLID